MISNLNIMYAIEHPEINISMLKYIFIIICSYYTNFKIKNIKFNFDLRMIWKNIIILIIAVLASVIKYEISYIISIISAVLLLSIVFDKNNISNSILTNIISISINHVISILSVMINFFINATIKVNNHGINLIVILIVHILLIYMLFKIKKFKYGFSFLQKKIQDENIDILILNISVSILLVMVIFPNYEVAVTKKLVLGFIICAVVMFITIQKSIQLYYKQKLLEQELNTTKEKLAKTEKDLEEAEKENIEISKKNHTITHKQKSLNHKIDEIIAKMETSTEIAIDVNELKNRVDKLSKEINEEKVETELTKTGITEIDDMLKYMQSECSKSKIDFQLQIKGNIHYMVNNLINKEDLETLIADHVRNAIIAIEHTDNVNKSILVKLGKIEETYSLYIYDSGVEFAKETLENLGKKPSTTHAEEGGTGMGFMNTFDTLRKYKASLTINEIGKPSKDDYTKVLIIKFNNKNEFNIISYREKEIVKI